MSAAGEVMVARFCARCGNTFYGEARTYVCVGCKRFGGITDAEPGQELTECEKRTTQFLAEGLTNKEIAQERHIAEGSIKNQVSVAFVKTSCSNRVQLANWWWRKTGKLIA